MLVFPYLCLYKWPCARCWVDVGGGGGGWHRREGPEMGTRAPVPGRALMGSGAGSWPGRTALQHHVFVVEGSSLPWWGCRVNRRDWARPLDSRVSRDWLFGAHPPRLRIDRERTWPLRMERWASSEDGGSRRPRGGQEGLCVGTVCRPGDRRPRGTPARECIEWDEPLEED